MILTWFLYTTGFFIGSIWLLISLCNASKSMNGTNNTDLLNTLVFPITLTAVCGWLMLRNSPGALGRRQAAASERMARNMEKLVTGPPQVVVQSSAPSSSPLQSKLQMAKELIQDKDYSAARSILRKIDHPTARDWLVKLDKIDPR
jgi:hypothetical protein